jgi:DNA polymerase-3 subunit gamma/tau
MSEFIVSARKYRPQTFDSVVGQAAITATLKNSIVRKRLAHAYLFCGPRGVGKTTCARIFAKTINCLTPTADMEACGKCECCRAFDEGRSYNIHELDAASNNSVDDIRQLTEQVLIPPQIGQYSVYIIDEVHMLSTAAFNAFLKTLEEPPSYAIFILATTEKHKILPTIISRCQVYEFNRIRVEDTIDYLKQIAVKEGVAADERALHVIAVKADGAMRDALSVFDQVVSFCGNDFSYEQVIDNLNELDYEYYFRITKSFLEHDYRMALLIFNEIVMKGFDPLDFIVGLSSHFRDILVCRDPQTAALMEAGESVRRQYMEQAAQAQAEFLFAAMNIVQKCAATYKQSGQQRFHVELCLLNLANITIGNGNRAAPVSLPAAGMTAGMPNNAAAAVSVAPPVRRAAPAMPAAFSIKEAMQNPAPAPVQHVPSVPVAAAATPNPASTPAANAAHADVKNSSSNQAFQKMAEQFPNLLPLQERMGLEY